MNAASAHPAPFATSRITGWTLHACVLGSALGWGIAYAAGWDISLALRSAFIVALVWVVAAFIGGLVLAVATRGDALNLGPAVLGSSSIRMMVALFGALPLYFLLTPHGLSFWTCFLCAGLLALVTEVALALKTLGAAQRGLDQSHGAR